MATKIISAVIMFTLFSACCQSQVHQNPKASVVVGGPFENGDYLYRGIPRHISSIDTSPGWRDEGQKLLVTGQIFKPDGKTPAAGVILYYYQTNTAGRYEHRAGETRSFAPNEHGQTHGYIRGWVKTGTDGRYAIYTIRPGTYPSRSEPAHIHISVKEPAIDNPYYLDDLVFDDDAMVTGALRRKMENRGGSGVLRVVVDKNLQIAEHNIVLGLHIPGYPQTKGRVDSIRSGLDIGEDQPSFTPYHAAGPDRGTRTCPVCKYGRYHGIILYAGNNPDWQDIRKWLLFLEKLGSEQEKFLKVYFVYGNDHQYNDNRRRSELEQLARELKITKTALTFVPSLKDQKSEVYLNRINPLADNTIVIYKNREIVGKYVNLEASSVNFKEVAASLSGADYFHLPELPHN